MEEKEIEVLNFDEELNSTSNVEKENVTFSILDHYGEDLTAKQFITNPAIARDQEIRKLILVLLTPEKSGLLVGKPGIGKTAIVEGLAYLIQRGEVPDALKNYRIIKFNSTSLVGKLSIDGKEELIMNILVQELKKTSKVIIFIDEIHTLIGGGESESMDLANMLKAGLDRGDIKAIGATTTIEYNTYIVRDRAFLRRFEKIDVMEPDKETTVKILMGTLPKIEKQTGIKMKYNNYITELLVTAIVEATSEYKRIYGLSAMYPDVSFSVLTAAFSEALFQNHKEVTIHDVYSAIKNSKRIYPDSIVKELEVFRKKFQPLCDDEGEGVLPIVRMEDVQNLEDNYS